MERIGGLVAGVWLVVCLHAAIAIASSNTYRYIIFRR